MLEKELFAAVIAGDEEKVRNLLEQGANPNAVNENEKNKLVYLVDKSQLARFKLFSQHNLGYLKDNAETIANQVQYSREESKNIVLKNHR